MQNVLSSRSRMDRVVADIVFDFGVKPRLSKRARQRHPGGVQHLRGLQVLRAVPEDGVQGPCAVVTSYNPQART
jgi:type I restriction enzyme R subunit